MAVDDTIDGNAVPQDFEVALRDMSGPLVAGRPLRGGNTYPIRIVALLLSGVLLFPIGVTVRDAFSTPAGFGFGNFAAVLGDSDARRAMWHSVLWVLVTFAVVVVAFGIALLSRRIRRVWRILLLVLVIPVGMSALVAGATFRLIFDQAPERGTVNALLSALHPGQAPPVWLGPGLIWIVLMSAFSWSWLGFAVSLFRAGLAAISPDVVRMARVAGVGGIRRLWTIILPTLRPVTAVVLLTLVVAAARLFDLIIVVAPTPVRGQVDVVATQWWTMTNTSAMRNGPAAALATMLYLVLAILALLGMRGLRHRWAVPEQRPGTEPEPAVRWRRWLSWSVGVLIIATWLYPVVMLLVTALRSVPDAGLFGWWQAGRDGMNLGSFGEAARAGMWGAVGDTLVLAVTATALVLLLAVPAAYLLAWGGLPRWLGRVVTVVLAVLAVAPVQMYAAPLGDLFTSTGQAGARLPLALVHTAAGMPFAVLLLRWAFTSTPARLSRREPLPELDRSGVFGWAWRAARPALIAVAVLEFVLVWNDFSIGFLVSGAGVSPLTLVLWGEARQFATSAGPVAASAVVSSVVPVVVLLANWQAVVRGLTGREPR